MNTICCIARITLTVVFLTFAIQFTNAWFLRENGETASKVKRQSPTEYKCKNGNLIDQRYVCDSYADCPDGDDEGPESCPNVQCSPDQFRCDDNTCVDKASVCNGKLECIDGSDEDERRCISIGVPRKNKTLIQKREIPEGYFCKNGESIPSLFKCDGKADCQDGSDEIKELCSDVVCFWNLFKCSYGACISQDKICDGRTDCVDNSDEDLDMCSSNGNQNLSLITRNRRQACDFRCGSGECVSIEQLCDGTADCKDGSDETRAQCGNVRCSSFLFQCKYGACIPKNQVCNGERNCADGSDEEGPNCGNRASESTCKNFEFRCNDGTCIDNLDVCDGTKNCPDGSDETENSCIGLICPTYLYRCAYGACVHKRSRCNGISECADGSDEAGCNGAPVTPTPPPVTPPVTPSAGCLLPPHPNNGKYQLTSGGAYQANIPVLPSTVIVFSCNDGYVPKEAAYFFCNEKIWDPDPKTASCKQTCKSLYSSETYDVRCRLGNSDVSCENPVDGTTAYLTCKPYYTFYGVRQLPSCADGNWDPFPAPCDPECGKKTVNAETLVIGGSNALPGEYPWMVAIYNTSENQKEHICGGSVISRLFVLSAAHCFSDSGGKVYDQSYYTLVAGRYYRDITINEPDAQVRTIKRLYVHEDYKGRHTKYRDDIALIEVDKFEMTTKVQPVCIDWPDQYEDRDFLEENKAVVAGWGFTTEGTSPAEVLKKLIVPFRSTDTCKKFMDADFFDQYYSSDKICAGYKDEGTSVCSGDSGGGLFFRSQPTTFYVRAVVSLAPRSQAGCNSNHYALYTKVSKFLSWLEAITRRRL